MGQPIPQNLTSTSASMKSLRVKALQLSWWRRCSGSPSKFGGSESVSGFKSRKQVMISTYYEPSSPSKSSIFMLQSSQMNSQFGGKFQVPPRNRDFANTWPQGWHRSKSPPGARQSSKVHHLQLCIPKTSWKPTCKKSSHCVTTPLFNRSASIPTCRLHPCRLWTMSSRT